MKWYKGQFSPRFDSLFRNVTYAFLGLVHMIWSTSYSCTPMLVPTASCVGSASKSRWDCKIPGHFWIPFYLMGPAPRFLEKLSPQLKTFGNANPIWSKLMYYLFPWKLQISLNCWYGSHHHTLHWEITTDHCLCSPQASNIKLGARSGPGR